jgi:pimeloyl-ACP methyl ester carboxylesterase
MIVAPLVFVVVFELMRVGFDGPTVDGVHFSTYGTIALVVGRGIHGLLVLVPMVLGAAVGAGLARRVTGEPTTARRGVGLVARRTVAGLTGAALVAIGVVVARPAGTDPIRGADGRPRAGSVAELTHVDIGGKRLGLMLRGHSTGDPVLLFLAGGPGGSEIGAMRRHLSELERHFVVATFDQRGTGRSYGALDPTSSLTLERAVADAIEVSEYLRERFGRKRIYVVGQSWGSTLGVLAVQRRPDLYEAFVGAGQMVSQRETDRLMYRDTLAWATRTGRRDVVSTLERIGQPPYENILDYEPALAHEHEVYPYDRTGNSEGEGGFSENLFVEEYSFLEQVHAFAGFLDTFSVLYPQLQEIDFRRQATRLDVPVFMVQGAHEARGRAKLADEWFAELEAPVKQRFLIDGTGHRPLFERPRAFLEVMTGSVLARIEAGRR